MVPISGTNLGTNVGTNVETNVQVVKKMSNVKIIKHLDYGGGSHTKKIDIMRFTHFDINSDVTYDAHQKPSKCP